MKPVAPHPPRIDNALSDQSDKSRTIVHLLRHGEVHNPTGVLYGRLPNFGLSQLGHEQAAKVGAALAGHDVRLIVASPLQRAQETAAPVAAEHGLSINTDADLIEAANSFEGLKVAAGDGALRNPRYWWRLRNPFKPSWGEPFSEIAVRMAGAIEKARLAGAGHEIVLVSHQLPVWTARLSSEGKRLWHDPRKRQCSLASLTSLVFIGDELVDIVYSEPAGTSDPRKTGA
ncbi:histidine phosphatase family protein [Smaragdicoccus niigatensis]|uniref:histidine phosphatase family protein n=1 Tax=Smaragdicoccus niigatensis TaxID=359359 RepID=UPI0003645A8C|nr:histidine phosphatase family protein [Smaragdicoccus niigatensis]